MLKSWNMHQFFNSFEDKIDLYKFCCNLFAGEAKLMKKIAHKLFLNLNSSKGSNCLMFLCWHICSKQFSGRVAQSKTCWWVELWV